MRWLPLVSLVSVMGACGDDAHDRDLQVCANCGLGQRCVYMRVMVHTTMVTEEARCLPSSGDCVAATPGVCSETCTRELCGGGPQACTYQAPPDWLPEATVSIFCSGG